MLGVHGMGGDARPQLSVFWKHVGVAAFRHLGPLRLKRIALTAVPGGKGFLYLIAGRIGTFLNRVKKSHPSRGGDGEYATASGSQHGETDHR